MPTLRHLYPGGNTALGFFNFFDQIMPLHRASRVFILKGGPGVGKSTFMKKIGDHLIKRGQNIEHFHCASDTDSLDGVTAPDIGLLVVDGTAPHIVDPKWPGAVDGILNLGDCLNEEALAIHREEIADMSADITRWFARAYRFLHAAQRVRDDSASLFQFHLIHSGLSHAVNALIENHLIAPTGTEPGVERRLFASAITPLGCVNTLSSMGARRYVCIKGPWTISAHSILCRLRDAALWRGLDVEGFYCALDPNRLEHLMITQTGTLFYTQNPYHGQDLPADDTLDLNAFVTLPTLAEQALLVDNESMFENLMERAVGALSKAKEQHDALEVHYVRHMDFDRADEMLEITLARVDALLG